MASLPTNVPAGHGGDRSPGRGQSCCGVARAEPGDRTGLSHGAAGHHFPCEPLSSLAHTAPSEENAQLWAESSEPDGIAGPSPSHDLSGGDLECHVETPHHQCKPSTQLGGDNKTCPLATAMCRVPARVIGGGLLAVSTSGTFPSVDGTESMNYPCPKIRLNPNFAVWALKHIQTEQQTLIPCRNLTNCFPSLSCPYTLNHFDL